MNRKSISGLVVFCMIIACFLTHGQASAATPDKVKIGLMFGLTGAASPIGPLQLDGAKLAIKEINAAGGVKFGNKKVPIEALVKDDESKPDVAIRRFRELVEESKVDVIVGQTFAPISAALNKEVKKTPVAYFPVNVVAINMFQKSEMAEQHSQFTGLPTRSDMPALPTLQINWDIKTSCSSARPMPLAVTSGRAPRLPLISAESRWSTLNHRLARAITPPI